jgi:hypothetical protein
MRASLLVAAVCAMAAFTWQALVVHYQYGGNWTGLYCTGERFPQRPPLEEKIWTFPNSYGYDGQWYHYVAHDPWFQRGYDRFFDAPRLRYRRVLVPALAHLLAGGQDRYIDRVYDGLMLLSVLLGSLWMSRYAQLRGFSPWVGLGFLLAPGVLVSVNRLIVDGVLATACAGFLWFLETNPGWPLYALLLAAPLVRETGILLPGGYVAALLLERRFGRAAVFSTAVAPTAAWYWVVARHTFPESSRWFHELPLAGYLHQLLNPNSYPLGLPGAMVVTVLDYVALAGVALAIVRALILLRRKTVTPVAIAIYGFTALATLLPTGDFWFDPTAFGRILTPLLLMLALESLRERRPAMALPMLMVTPRIAAQFAGRLAVRVAKAMLG